MAAKKDDYAIVGASIKRNTYFAVVELFFAPMPITGAKVFSATVVRDREALGEKVTSWIRANPDISIVRTEIRQSSDARFHCLSLVVFWTDAAPH